MKILAPVILIILGAIAIIFVLKSLIQIIWPDFKLGHGRVALLWIPILAILAFEVVSLWQLDQ